VQHDGALAQHEAVERAANAGPATGSRFEQSEQSVTKGARMRETEVRSVLGHEFDQARAVGHDINRPRFDFREHALMEVLYGRRHS
jgi:hypothetical protein